MSRSLPFERFYAPDTQEELFQLLRNEGSAALVLAGGTDLFVAMKQKGLRVQCLVDLKRIAELRGIESRQPACGRGGGEFPFVLIIHLHRLAEHGDRLGAGDPVETGVEQQRIIAFEGRQIMAVGIAMALRLAEGQCKS